MKRNFARILRDDVVAPFAVGWIMGTGFTHGRIIDVVVAIAMAIVMIGCDIWEVWEDLD